MISLNSNILQSALIRWTEVFGTKWFLANTYYPLHRNKNVFQTKFNRNVFKEEVKIESLLSCIRHLAKGSPVKPAAQVHIGLWFTTWQRALKPHVPGHGSWHLWLIQARFCGQSELTTHWGLHVGGEPTQPDWQEHTAWLSTTRHTLLGPHGLGKQGFVGQTGATAVYQRRKKEICYVKYRI
jgi:hypothetical protein